MRTNSTKRTRSKSPKIESSESIAARLGVSASSVYSWRSTGRLPKNRKTRAAFLRALGLTDPAKA